jgi:hypothetical protein
MYGLGFTMYSRVRDAVSLHAVLASGRNSCCVCTCTVDNHEITGMSLHWEIENTGTQVYLYLELQFAARLFE